MNSKSHAPPHLTPTPPCPPHYHGNTPKTGDDSHVFENALLMLASGTGLAISYGALRYLNDQEKAKVLKKTRY